MRVLYVSTLAFTVLAICVYSRTKRMYEKGKPLPLWLSISWWIVLGRA